MLTTDVLEGLELDLGDAFFGDVVPLDVRQLPWLADANVPEYFEKIGSICGLKRFQPLGGGVLKSVRAGASASVG